MKRYRVMRRWLVRYAALELQTTGTIDAGLVEAIARWDRRILAEELLALTRAA